MKLTGLLGSPLKDDAVHDLLIQFNMDVTYQFDRLREGAADHYTADAKADGFTLRFNESQILSTVFCYVLPKAPFVAIDPQRIGAPLYASVTEASAAGRAQGAGISLAENINVLGRTLSWIRLDFDKHAIHYEYEKNALAMVTLIKH